MIPMKNRTPRARHVRHIAPLCLRPCVLAVLSLVSAHAAQAQPIAAPVLLAQNARMPSLQDTVVTATRTEQPLADLVADVSIVDRETIESSGAAGVGDVLARLPGIEMGRAGGPGGNTSIFVRGAETRFAAVYIDGVRVDSQAGSGGTTWEAIPLAQIERIEVLRGPAAAVYGSDAVAGVIQIFTKKGEAGVAPYVGVGAGTHGTYRTEAGVSGARGTVDYALGLARETSNGFNAKLDGNPDRDDHRSTAANGRLGWQLNTAHRVEGNFLYNDTDGGYDGSYDVSKPADDRSLHRMHAAGLNWQTQWNDNYKTRLSVTDSRDRYETQPSFYLTNTQLRNYLFFNELRQGVHQFTAALERREDDLSNSSVTDTRSRSQNALALGYGLRLDRHTLQLNARHDDDSEFGGKSTGSAAYGFAFAPNWRATASAGTAFKAPTLFQRFSLYGDDTLRPETSRNVELGLKWAEGSNNFSATLYRNNVSNLIDWQRNTGTCAGNSGRYPGCYANVGKARYEGLTLAGAYRLGAMQLRGSLDLQSPKNLDTGRLLGRRARQHAVLGADTRLLGWTLGAELQASGERYDDNANAVPLGGYALVNLYASTRVARDYLVYARLDNLADKDYALARNYATAGRTIFVGVKWAPQ
jgi:vitamin B12 transporter